MNIDLEKILACPKCKNRIEIVSEDKIKIKKGAVNCSHCAIKYPIDNELFDFAAESNIYSDGNWQLDYFVEGYKEMAKLRDHYDWARHDRIPQLVESYRLPLMRGRLLEWLKPKDGDIILDIGCGAGLLIFQIKKIYPDKNIFILGLDVVRNNIRILIDRKSKEEKSDILGITGYAEELPILNACIDIILCSETLEHIYDKRKAVREMARVLKPSGRLLISTPSKEIVRFWEDVFYLPRVIKKILNLKPLREKPRAYDKPIAKKQLINLLLDSGMEIVKFEQNAFLLPESYYSKIPYLLSLIWVKLAKSFERNLKKITGYFGINYVVEAKKSYKQADRLFYRTKDIFAYEWLRYPLDLEEEETLRFFATVGLRPESFKNKLVLDAGCGMGRYSRIVDKWAKQVVAFDLSSSVERIKEITKPTSNIYPLQANIIALPFRNNIFDIVFSIGVIQHIPYPELAFKHLSCLLKSGGIMSIHVYVRKSKSIQELKQTTLEKDEKVLLGNIENNFFKRIIFQIYLKFRFLRIEMTNLIRKVTTKIPKRILYIMALATIPKIGRFTLLNFIIPCSSHPDMMVRIIETFDWYAPTYQWYFKEEELISWFKEAGFQAIEVIPHGFSPVSVTVKGIKK